MTKEELKRILDELAEKIKNEIRKRMEDKGYNERARKNTLVGSKLYDSVKVKSDASGELAFEIADYWEYVALGWKRSGRFPNTMKQFIENIKNWIVEKGIHFEGVTQNAMIYLIIRKIMTLGIKPRPFITYDPNEDPSKILPFLDKFFDDWADMAFDEITKELDEYFK